MRTLRWTGIIVCAAIAVFDFVGAVIDLTENWAGGFGRSLAITGFFGLSAVLLWRRPGWKRAGMAFGLLILGIVVLYVVLIKLRAHGFID